MKKIGLILCWLVGGVSSFHAATVSRPAVINTHQQATISSPMTGTIERIHARTGVFIKKGALLVQYDCRNAQAELEKSEANLEMRRGNLHAVRRLERLDSASTRQVAEAKAGFKEAQANVKIARLHVEHCRIASPFSGQVVELMVHAHETVQLHQPLLKLLDNEQLHIEVLLPSEAVAWVKAGMTFSLHINETGKKYQACVQHIIRHVDSVSQSIKVVGNLSAAHPELTAGMSGEATFEYHE